MKSVEATEKLFKRFEESIAVFAGKDPEPISPRQRKNLHGWQLLFRSSGNARSKTRRSICTRSHKNAEKIRKVAGDQTLMLFFLEYSVSSSPQITYNRFFDMLYDWSKRTSFPERLQHFSSTFWTTPVEEQFRSDPVTSRSGKTGTHHEGMLILKFSWFQNSQTLSPLLSLSRDGR